jgi:hypothetical protein
LTPDPKGLKNYLFLEIQTTPDISEFLKIKLIPEVFHFLDSSLGMDQKNKT